MWSAKATSGPLLLLPLHLVSAAHQYCSTCHSHRLGVKLWYLLRAESQARLHDNQQPQGIFPDDLFLDVKLLYLRGKKGAQGTTHKH